VNTKIFATSVYQDVVKETAAKERELARLIQVKSEKLCNNFLIRDCHTQFSYLSKGEQAGAIATPKGIILDRLIAYLQSI
jgi:hypothetical protein